MPDLHGLLFPKATQLLQQQFRYLQTDVAVFVLPGQLWNSHAFMQAMVEAPLSSSLLLSSSGESRDYAFGVVFFITFGYGYDYFRPALPDAREILYQVHMSCHSRMPEAPSSEHVLRILCLQAPRRKA